MVSSLGGEAMMTMDPPRIMSTSRELPNDDMFTAQEVKVITPDERKNKKKTLKNELHEVFNKVEINIPLLELICKVPVYARFLKDLCTKKKRLEGHEVYRIEGHVSSMIQHNLPPKRKDPGSFTIGCQIGETHLDGALMDLGASVNVMPLSLYKRLSIGALQPTPIALTFADRGKRSPAGVVEDVLVRVDKFILPADFIVLDIGDDPNGDNGFPLIFGRPFMATAGVKINVLKGTISFKVLGEKVKFEMFKPVHPPEVVEEVFAIDLVKGNSAKSERIFGPLNPPKPTPRTHDHFSPIWGYDNLPPIAHTMPSPCSHDEIIGTDLFLEGAKKKSPPMNELQKATIKGMREMVGEVKKKKYAWPPPSKSIFNGIKGCFVGSHGDGETSNTLNGKKLYFEPP